MVQPKDRRQISALKDLRKKQYLDYIKSKSEDNYMKFYYKGHLIHFIVNIP